MHDTCTAVRLCPQVKLRGMRLELGEVEAAAQSCPLVPAAAAVVADARLVLFVKPKVRLRVYHTRTNHACTCTCTCTYMCASSNPNTGTYTYATCTCALYVHCTHICNARHRVSMRCMYHPR